LPPAIGYVRGLCKLPTPQWGTGGAAKGFGAFWVHQVSSPAVLLLQTAKLINLTYYYGEPGAKGYFRPRGFNIAAASAPAVPTPLFSCMTIDKHVDKPDAV